MFADTANEGWDANFRGLQNFLSFFFVAEEDFSSFCRRRNFFILPDLEGAWLEGELGLVIFTYSAIS